MRKFEPHKQNQISKPLFSSKDAGLTFTAAAVSVLAVSLIFSIVISSLMVKSGLEAKEFQARLDGNFIYKLFSYLLSSVAILLAICAISYYKKQVPFKGLPFKRTGWKYYIIAPALAFGLLFGFGELNNIFIKALEAIGLSSPPVTLPNEEWWQYAVWIIVVAILPAVLEESLFRGYILEGLKGHSTLFITLVGGLFFSLFHQNPQQTPYQFVCGAVYFLFALRCGSMFPVILMHLLNNLFIITSDFFKWQISQTATVVLTVLGLLVFAACFIHLVFFDKNNGEDTEKSPVKPTKKDFFLFSVVGVMICAVMWVSQFFA